MGILVELSSCIADPIIAGLRNAAPDIPVWQGNENAPAYEVETILASSLRPGSISSYANLRFINGAAAAVDHLLALPDLPAHIPVTRVVDFNKQTGVAHFVLATALRHTRGAESKNNASPNRRLSRGKVQLCRVGVFGLGEIGSAVARMFAAIDFPVFGWSRSHKDIPGVVSHAGASGLREMLAVSDVMVCTLPLTPQTYGLLNHETLSLLPEGAYVINVGWREHVVERDLVAMIEAEKLAGAAFHLFSNHPSESRAQVFNHPRIKATPHTADEPSYELIAQQCIDNVRRARDGRPLLYVVDREVGY